MLTIDYLQIFQSRYFFSKKHCNGLLTKAQIMTLVLFGRIVGVTCRQELETSGILSKAINHPFKKTLLAADLFTVNAHHTSTAQAFSLRLTMDFSNFSNHCCRFTHAAFTQYETACLAATSSRGVVLTKQLWECTHKNSHRKTASKSF